MADDSGRFVVSGFGLGPKGEFDRNHIIGTETRRGVAPELAQWRALVVEDVVLRAGVMSVSTDAIRYVLDGIRDYPIDARIDRKDLESFIEYTKESSARLDVSFETNALRQERERSAKIPEFQPAMAEPGDEVFPLRVAPASLVRHQLLSIGRGVPEHGEGGDPRDAPPPALYGEEIATSGAPAAFFVSDLHFSDGGAGDDALYPHLRPFKQFVVGTGTFGQSSAHQLAAAIAFAQARLLAAGIAEPMDVVLNGDIIDQLEMIGRGTGFSYRKHGILLSLCQNLRSMGHAVYYVRGNHDFLPPAGPWTVVDAYANGTLTTFAEHGDRYDPFNWPKGLKSTGARLVTGTANGTGLARLEEVLAYTSLYEMHFGSEYAQHYFAGIDNVRPLDASTIVDFLNRRNALPLAVAQGAGRGVDAVLTVVREEIGQQQGYDERSEMSGVKARRAAGGPYANWLVVMGHTHNPVSIPGAYYNTGTWIPVLRLLPHGESFVHVNPFLLVYAGNGTRVEEFYTLNVADTSSAVWKRDQAGVNRLRSSLFGIPEITALP